MEIDFASWGYCGVAVGMAVTFHLFVKQGVTDLHPDRRIRLSHWLMGAARESWAKTFCEIFDQWFGERHLSLKCIMRSALASVAAVALIYTLLGPILNVLENRAGEGLPLVQALFLGAAINILPDYLSLLQTRFLLRLFQKMRKLWTKALALIVDVILTGAIIFGAIWMWRWLLGEAPLAPVELVGIFSIYSVFFYSTFLTSVLAWAYGLTAALMRVSNALWKGKWIDAEKHPELALAYAGAPLVFIMVMIAKPVMVSSGAVDRELCRLFPADACIHVARLTNDDLEKFHAIDTACEKLPTSDCVFKSVFEIGGDYSEAVQMLENSCSSGIPSACTYFGMSLDNGIQLQRNEEKAYSLFLDACDLGDYTGCTQIARYYEKGIFVERNSIRALELYEKSCDGKDVGACSQLSWMLFVGDGVYDIYRAERISRELCDDEVIAGCMNLKLITRKMTEIISNSERAARESRSLCESGHASGCVSLGYRYSTGSGVDHSYELGAYFYSKGCDLGDFRGCSNFGSMLQSGEGGVRDDVKAIDLFHSSCSAGFAPACNNLAAAYLMGLHVEQNTEEAWRLFDTACRAGFKPSCYGRDLLE